MKTKKQKVTDLLIKWGNNVNDVHNMVNIHFDYAITQHTNINSIAECIRTIY